MTKKAKKVSGEEHADALETIEALTAERDEYLAKYQRAHADCQNMRRRAVEDNEDRIRRRLQPLLESLLLVIDNLEMALACPAESPEAKNLAMGVRMTRDQLLSALGTEDVQRIEAKGPFDPSRHQAVEVVEETDVEPGHVIDCTRHGYSWRDLVLRSAQVRVAPGQAAGENDEANEAEATAEAQADDVESGTSEASEAPTQPQQEQ